MMMIIVALVVYLTVAVVTMLLSARFEFTDTAGSSFGAGLVWPVLLPIIITVMFFFFVIAPLVAKYVEGPAIRLFDWARNACPECRSSNGNHHVHCRIGAKSDADV